MNVFYVIVSRGALPIYLFSEVVDNLTRLGKNSLALYKWRQFVYKLQKLKDVESNEEEGNVLQCCICLGNIKKGKQLSCTHVFHMNCLRGWLI
jgi:E3 ubiquitin-protein ligase synoviolin